MQWESRAGISANGSFRALTGLGCRAAVRLLRETSRSLTFTVAGYAVGSSILPNLVVIATGRRVRDITGTARSLSGGQWQRPTAITGTGRAGGPDAQLYEMQARLYR